MSNERPVTRAQIMAAQDPRSAASLPGFEAQTLYLQDQQVPEAELTADEEAFSEAFKGQFVPLPILMSRTNPYGRKLEELLVQLRGEIEAKNANVVLDDSPVAQAVAEANRRIMNSLFEAEGVQRRLLAMLDCVGPDRGPLGRPRVGLGSPK